MTQADVMTGGPEGLPSYIVQGVDLEQQIGALFNQSPIGVGMLGPDRTLLSLNEAGAEILGVDADRLVGLDPVSLLMGPNADVTGLDKVLQGDLDRYQFERRLERSGRGEIWVQGHLQAVRSQDGALAYVLAMFEDVTAQKRAATALSDSEARIRAIFDSAPIGLAIKDANNTVTLANHAAEAMFAVSKGELVGKVLKNMLAPSYPPRNEGFESKIVSGKIDSFEFERVYARQDGTEFRAKGNETAVRNDEGFEFSILSLVDVTDEHAAKIALAESEEAFRILFEDAPMGLALKDEHNLVVRANGALEDMFQVAPGELNGTEIRQRRDPHMPPHVTGGLERLLTGTQDRFTYERPFLRNDGSRMWAKGVQSAVRGPDGRYRYTVLVMEDITAQKHAKEALSASEERFRVLFESAPIGLAVKGRDNKIESANAAAERIFGRTREELTGSTFAEFRSPTADIPERGSTRRLIEGAVDSFSYERLYLHGDGANEVWVRGLQSGVRDEQGDLQYSIVSLEDITEQRAAGEALRESEERFRVLFESSPVGLILQAPDLSIDAVNPAAIETFGLSEQEMIGTSLKSHLHPTFTPEGRHDHEAMVRGEMDLFEFERPYAHADGSAIWIRGRQAAVRDEDGRFVTAVVALDDVTEGRAALRQIQQSEERFRTLFEESPVTLALIDQHERITDVNAAAEAMFDATKAQIIGTTMRDWLSPDFTQEGLGRNARLLSGEIDRFEFDRRYQHRDGTPFWVKGKEVALTTPDGGRIALAALDDVTEERVAQESLRSSEEQFRVLFESSPIGLILVASNRKIIRANAVAAEMFGTTPEKMLGTSTIERLSPSFERARLGDHDRIISGERARTDFERMYMREDGVEFWARGMQAPVHDPEGRYQFSVIAMEDVTTEKAAQEEIESSQERFRVLFEEAPLGVALVSDTREIIQVNPAILTMFRVPEAQLLGSTFMSWLSPDFELAGTGVHEDLLSGKIDRYDYQRLYRRPDGSEFWAKGAQNAVRDADGAMKYAVIVLEDVTEKLEAEEALAESEERYRTIFESSPVGIATTDRATNIVSANPALERLLGHSEAELIGRKLMEFRSPNDVGFGLNRSQEVASGAAERSVSERLLMRKGGEEIWTQVVTARNPHGEGLIRMVVDISERKIAEQVKDDFLSMVSHELRTPLTAIVTSVQLSATGALGPVPDKVQRMLEIASENSDRLMRMVNDVLDMERMASGKIALSPMPVDMASVAEQAARAAGAKAAEQGVLIELITPSVRFTADEDRIVQALTNLLANAAKFSPPNTSVELYGEDEGDHVVFRVVDQGRGVPEEERDLIFDRFHQVERSDSQVHHGTGLGLAITRWIAEEHGGEVWVESDLGVGSTFVLRLPKQSGAMDSR